MRAAAEEFTRKNLTLEMMVANVEAEASERTEELTREIEELRSEHQIRVNCLEMYTEEMLEKARINWDKYKNQAIDYRQLNIQHTDTAKRLKNSERLLDEAKRANERSGIRI